MRPWLQIAINSGVESYEYLIWLVELMNDQPLNCP